MLSTHIVHFWLHLPGPLLKQKWKEQKIEVVRNGVMWKELIFRTSCLKKEKKRIKLMSVLFGTRDLNYI